MVHSGEAFSTYALDVLGCKVNRYDSRQIARLLEGFGLRQAAPGETASLGVVHCCGVTKTAMDKSRQAVNRLRRLHPEAVVFVTGCAAEVVFRGDDPEIGACVAAGPGWLQRLAGRVQEFPVPNPAFQLPDDPDLLPAGTFGEQTRAYLKIQDGCDAHCAYCIVPRLRKEPRDKPIEAALEEAREAVRRGCREMVVAGVHLGLYGRTAGVSLAEALDAIAKIPGLPRVRMSSLHPSELTGELLEVWATHRNIMPHLHLSLQSGSDRVLQRMGRGYTAAEYLEAAQRFQAAMRSRDDGSMPPAITTDVIAGFPGETDCDVAETEALCRAVGFAAMHVFPFSPRPGTRAAEMDGRVPGAIARARQRVLAELGRQLAAEYRQLFVGQTVRVLVEQHRSGRCTGYSEQYVPVRFEGGNSMFRTIVPVCVTASTATGLEGEIAGTLAESDGSVQILMYNLLPFDGKAK